MPNVTAIREKVRELSDVLQAEGLWKQEEPDWVTNYHHDNETCQDDFFEWLQFIYLPNLLQIAENGKHWMPRQSLAPQAVSFFNSDASKGKLLRLLVELDSLT
jgi:uncharacterized protein YqcC (DUF446 family)